jgi:hypothetical protein
VQFSSTINDKTATAASTLADGRSTTNHKEARTNVETNLDPRRGGDTWRARHRDHDYVITDLGTAFRVARKGWHSTRVPTLDSAQKLAEAWEAGVVRDSIARD